MELNYSIIVALAMTIYALAGIKNVMSSIDNRKY